MHHADAARLRGRGIIGKERFYGAVESNMSQRRRCDSAQDSHQRRLTGAVAANKSDHVGIGDREVDVGIGEGRSKDFGYPLQLDKTGRRDRARLNRRLRRDIGIRQWPTPARGRALLFRERPIFSYGPLAHFDRRFCLTQSSEYVGLMICPPGSFAYSSRLLASTVATGMIIIFGAFAPPSNDTPSQTAAPPIPGVVFIEIVWYPFFLFSSAHHFTKSVPPPPSM